MLPDVSRYSHGCINGGIMTVRRRLSSETFISFEIQNTDKQCAELLWDKTNVFHISDTHPLNQHTNDIVWQLPFLPSLKIEFPTGILWYVSWGSRSYPSNFISSCKLVNQYFQSINTGMIWFRHASWVKNGIRQKSPWSYIFTIW